MLPSLGDLAKISQQVKNIPNKKGEYLRKVHYGCFLLGFSSGLRISEAIRLDLGSKNKQGLYRLEKPKGKKERWVYVPKSVIKELKANNWKPNQTNRWNFYCFLQKIKRELNISPKIELTPHTLRRAFTTYHAEKGMPLPLLQKLLGHSSIRTTALYWKNIHGDKDTDDILAGKKWLERPKEPPKTPNTENFPQTPSKPAINTKKPSNKDNSLTITKTEKKPIIANYQPQFQVSEISLKNLGENEVSQISLNTSQQLPLLTDKSEENNEKEQFLLTRIKQLEEQLKQVQAENKHLKLENKHLKALVQQEQKTTAKIIQPLPIFKKNAA